MHTPKIKTAIALNDHVLLIEFDNQQRKIYDVTPLLSRAMFEPLKNKLLFNSVSVEQGGYAVAWGSEIDISEYELWQHGKNYSENISF